jgi:hypothetical protein
MTSMEHLSPGSNVIMMFAASVVHPNRQAFITGIACAPAVGHDCGTVVGQGVAVGAAQAVRSTTSTRINPRLKNCLWFILSSFFFEYISGFRLFGSKPLVKGTAYFNQT